MYVEENNALTGFRGLAIGIVLQAITDWWRLVKGAKETGDCNFKELEHFFRYECDRYLKGTSMTGEEILKMLKAEQRSALYINTGKNNTDTEDNK